MFIYICVCACIYIYIYTHTYTKGGLKSYDDVISADDGCFWLVVWVSWHINICRLFNAKSIFIQIISSI